MSLFPIIKSASFCHIGRKYTDIHKYVKLSSSHTTRRFFSLALVMYMKYVIYSFLLILSFHSNAQNSAIGQWTSHFSYGNAMSVAYDGQDAIYCADKNLYRYNLSEKSFDIFSKVNGLSDINIKLIRYNQDEDYLIIIYENGNIDLLTENTIYNIPDIKNLNTSGSKNINDIFFYNKLAYLSTDFGVVVLNSNRREIKETYELQANSIIAKISSFTLYKGQFMAASDIGLFVVDENIPVLQDYQKWTLVPNLVFSKIASHPTDYIFASADTLLLHSTSALISNWDTIDHIEEPIVRLILGAQQAYFLENGPQSRKIHMYDFQGTKNNTYSIGVNPLDLTETGTTYHIADGFAGLTHIDGNGSRILIHPEGPFSNAAFNMSIADNKLFISGGGHSSWLGNSKRDGISSYDYSDWGFYNQYTNVPAMDSIVDILDVTIDPSSKNVLAASYSGGLLEIKPDNSVEVYKSTQFFEPFGGTVRVVDLQHDDDGNLWISNYGASKSLVVRKADGTWNSYTMPYAPGTFEKTASEILIDDNNQKWMIAPRNIGLFVFNDNGTLDITTDDQTRLLKQGAGNGNLPNNNINCITKDKDGAIWVGTNDGIGIFNCPGSMFTNGCDAELRIVQYDANAGLLFQNENVRTIAVDGANNKWIGTGNGIWQISDDAETILKRFTADNSPLPSDEINKITIHPETGDVFIATANGIISYRSEATEGYATSENILVFPNPVPSGYGGTIAIKGVTENADVRITDVSGQLVYRVKAQGGQAVWNGQTYTGQRPMSGVYYVFVTDRDGKETGTAKFIYHE